MLESVHLPATQSSQAHLNDNDVVPYEFDQHIDMWGIPGHHKDSCIKKGKKQASRYKVGFEISATMQPKLLLRPGGYPLSQVYSSKPSLGYDISIPVLFTLSQHFSAGSYFGMSYQSFSIINDFKTNEYYAHALPVFFNYRFLLSEETYGFISLGATRTVAMDFKIIEENGTTIDEIKNSLEPNRIKRLFMYDLNLYYFTCRLGMQFIVICPFLSYISINYKMGTKLRYGIYDVSGHYFGISTGMFFSKR